MVFGGIFLYLSSDGLHVCGFRWFFSNIFNFFQTAKNKTPKKFILQENIFEGKEFWFLYVLKIVIDTQGKVVTF